MTQNHLNEIIREIKDVANQRAGADSNTDFVLSAKTTIATLKDVYKGVE